MNNQENKNNSRKAQAEERRRQIVDTALRVFGTRGFQGTSIKDIAREAGISQGLMYHYFSSKEELLREIISQYGFLPQLKLMLKENRDLPIDTVFSHIAEGFFQVLDSKKMLINILIRDVRNDPEVGRAWAELCRQGVALIQEYMEEQIRRGKLKPHNAEIVARNLFGMMFMYHFTQDIFELSEVNRKQYIAESIKITLEGIGVD